MRLTRRCSHAPVAALLPPYQRTLDSLGWGLRGLWLCMAPLYILLDSGLLLSCFCLDWGQRCDELKREAEADGGRNEGGAPGAAGAAGAGEEEKRAVV